MKHIFIATFIIVLAAAVAGCGGGKDASFSPDPSIAQVPGGQDAPGGGDVGGGDGGDGTVNTGETAGGEPDDEDCFLNGFCYRACKVATECPQGFSCILYVCTYDCQTDQECGSGGKCNEVGLCEVAEGGSIPACSSDVDCGDGRFCNGQGQCEQIPITLGCQGDIDCPMGQYCGEEHSCKVLPEMELSCTIDSNCLGDSFCNGSHICEQECRSDVQCSEGASCNNVGKCVSPSTPLKLVSFSFGSLRNEDSGSSTFGSTNFKLKNVEMTVAGRNQVLTSTHFRLIGNADF